MVVQYPHKATFTISGSEATQDSNGDWQAGTPDIETTVDCRAESASNNGYIASVDSVKIDYSWIVYLPLNTAMIKVGTSVSVINDTEEILKDTVKRFSRGQLNCRVWL